MGILREGIVASNECLDQIGNLVKELSSISEGIIDYLNGNTNFQLFREGTDKGNAIYSDLKECVSTIVNKLLPTIEKMSATTYNMLNEQKVLNRAESQSIDRREYGN